MLRILEEVLHIPEEGRLEEEEHRQSSGIGGRLEFRQRAYRLWVWGAS